MKRLFLFLSLIVIFLVLGITTPCKAALHAIKVDIPNCKLYLIANPNSPDERVEKIYIVSTHRKGKYFPKGKAVIDNIIFNPYWYPTKNQRKNNPSLSKRYSAGDPKNPMGKCKMILNFEDIPPEKQFYRIHGTNKPDQIGIRVTSGCIRMKNKDVLDLSKRILPGTVVYFIRTKKRS